MRITLSGTNGCINRNILECKGGQCVGCRLDYSVLIETYWNVKVNTGIPCGSPLHVLIETYWNVKYFHTLLSFLASISY